ncbi:MAG: hypothetical protein AVDCRST_MAG87-2480, partial [uncultured Thermomicrobiales bacterium]
EHTDITRNANGALSRSARRDRVEPHPSLPGDDRHPAQRDRARAGAARRRGAWPGALGCHREQPLVAGDGDCPRNRGHHGNRDHRAGSGSPGTCLWRGRGADVGRAREGLARWRVAGAGTVGRCGDPDNDCNRADRQPPCGQAGARRLPRRRDQLDPRGALEERVGNRQDRDPQYQPDDVDPIGRRVGDRRGQRRQASGSRRRRL